MQGSIISLIRDIRMNMVTWVHIEGRDIIFQNFSDEDNREVGRNYSTESIHHYDVLSNVHLEFGRKDGESCKPCLSFLTNHRLKLLSHQWHCTTIFDGSQAKMLHSTSLIAILISFLQIFFPMSFHNHNHEGTKGRRVWIIFVMALQIV